MNQAQLEAKSLQQVNKGDVSLYDAEQIAASICKELNGAGPTRLKAMIGAKDFVYDKKDLNFSFKFKLAGGVNFCRITLNVTADLYVVEFGKLSKKRGEFIHTYTPKRIETGVYGDMLREMFQSQTGLCLTL